MGKPHSLSTYPYRCYVDRTHVDAAIEYCLITLGGCYSGSNWVRPIRAKVIAAGHLIEDDYRWNFKGYHQQKVRFLFANKKDLFTFSIKFGVQGWQAKHPDTPQLELETLNA